MKHILTFVLLTLSLVAKGQTRSEFKVGLSDKSKVMFDASTKLSVTDSGFHTKTLWYSFIRRKPEFISYNLITKIYKEGVNKRGDFFFVFETGSKKYILGYNTRKDRRRFLLLVSQYLPDLMREGDLYVEDTR